MRHWFTAAVLALPLIAVAPLAQAAGFENVVLSTVKDAADNMVTFTTNTPIIYLSADLVDVATSSKVTVAWVSVDSHGAAPPNFVIATVDITIDNGQDHINSEMSKPTNGWPVGTYRVDIDINGTVAKAADFEVK